MCCRGEDLAGGISTLDLLLTVELTEWAAGRTGVRPIALVDEAVLFVVPDLEGLVCGVMVGVPCLVGGFLLAYGSAVAGRFNSGRRGLRAGADVNVLCVGGA